MHQRHGALAVLPDRTLSDQLLRHLRKAIVLGRIAPGTRLIEHRLAAELSVSRSTIREVLRRLEGEGLVEISPHRGGRVAYLTPDDAYELCELHALIGKHCTRSLALPIRSSLRDELARIISRMRTLQLPDDVNEFIDLDNMFHFSLVRAAGQRQALRVWIGLSSQLAVLVTFSLRFLPVTAEWTANRHQAILDALCQGDVELAAETVEFHYRSLAQHIRHAVEYSMQTETAS